MFKVDAKLDQERFSQMNGHGYRTPEQRLCLAVFERAVRDYIGTTERVKDANGYRYNGISPQDRASAEAYLFDPTFYDGPYSLEAAADLLGFEPDALRALCRKAFAYWHPRGNDHQPKCRRK